MLSFKRVVLLRIDCDLVKIINPNTKIRFNPVKALDIVNRIDI